MELHKTRWWRACFIHEAHLTAGEAFQQAVLMYWAQDVAPMKRTEQNLLDPAKSTFHITRVRGQGLSPLSYRLML